MADTRNMILPASWSINLASSASNLKTVAAESRKKKKTSKVILANIRRAFDCSVFSLTITSQNFKIVSVPFWCASAFSSSVYAILSIPAINPSTIDFPASVAVSTVLVGFVYNVEGFPQSIRFSNEAAPCIIFWSLVQGPGCMLKVAQPENNPPAKTTKKSVSKMAGERR